MTGRLVVALRRNVIGIMALLVALGGTSYAVAGVGSRSVGTISYACVAKGSHALSLSRAEATCPPGQRKVSFRGIQGDPGVPGAVGPKGDTGAVGLTGPQGDTGPAGPQGDTGPAGPQGVAGLTLVSSGLTEADGDILVSAGPKPTIVRTSAGHYAFSITGFGAGCVVPSLTSVAASVVISFDGGGCGSGSLTTTVVTSDGVDHSFSWLMVGSPAASPRPSGDASVHLPGS